MFPLPEPARSPPAPLTPGSGRIRPGPRATLSAPVSESAGGKRRAAAALRVPHRHTWGPSPPSGSRWQAAQEEPPPRRPQPPAPGCRGCRPASPAPRGPQPSPPPADATSVRSRSDRQRTRKYPSRAEVPPRPARSLHRGRGRQRSPPLPEGGMDWSRGDDPLAHACGGLVLRQPGWAPATPLRPGLRPPPAAPRRRPRDLSTRR